MKDFQSFSKLVHARYTAMAANEMFVVGTDNHAVSDAYLAAFPEGTNPVYLTNTEHDCSCCKNFIRNLGNLITITDGKVQTVWDIEGAPHPYDVVAKAMADYVRALPVMGIFRSSEGKYGAEFNMQQLEDGSAKRWNHFHGVVTAKHFTKEVGARVGEYNAAVQVFRRGLSELTREALDEVRGLIDSNSLYRGAEHTNAVAAFHTLYNAYHATAENARDLFVWEHASNPAARFRNTVIGTLVTDLSEGAELEVAVKAFESKVAPANYKRPTALVTPRMVQDALKTIDTLGLEFALKRRFAKLSDVAVNNVLWVDNSVQGQMKGGLESLLMEAVKAQPVGDVKTQPITIDAFMADVLPKARSMELLVQNNHMGNFVSLTAPSVADVSALFKWDNDFAWSYSGNVADSIKERVKLAGGKVEGDVCCRLAWNNTSDLDLHMHEPMGGHIYYINHRRSLSGNGGMLDLDANGVDGMRSDPAENIVYADASKMRDGVYRLAVHVYSKRSTDHKDFELELEVQGTVYNFGYDAAWKLGETILVAELHKKGAVIEVKPLLKGGVSRPSKTFWGVKTEQFVKVNTAMFSPNYWDDNAVGNKHWMFMLDGCINPEATRGIYNEFLNARLDKHRKVFEILGDKTKCVPVDDQLSGLGFSSTRGDTVTVKVTTPEATKAYNIVFN